MRKWLKFAGPAVIVAALGVACVTVILGCSENGAVFEIHLHLPGDGLAGERDVELDKDRVEDESEVVRPGGGRDFGVYVEE